MSAFQQKYSDQQKRAAVAAYLDRGIQPMKSVLAMAKAGELWHEGARVEPFDMPLSTFRSELKRERMRRVGRIKSQVAKLPAHDAVDQLRVRLVNLAASELDRQEKAKVRDPEKIRQIARAVREIAALPGAKEGRTHQPGQRDPATQRQNEGPTRNGLAGAILAASRSNGGNEGSPAPEPPIPGTTPTENTAPGTTAGTDEGGESAEHEALGSLQRVPATSRSLLLARP